MYPLHRSSRRMSGLKFSKTPVFPLLEDSKMRHRFFSGHVVGTILISGLLFACGADSGSSGKGDGGPGGGGGGVNGGGVNGGGGTGAYGVGGIGGSVGGAGGLTISCV